MSQGLSRYIDIIKHKHKNPRRQNQTPFTKNDIDILWDIAHDNRYYQAILILIYTGLRITEMLELKKVDINLKDQYFDVIKSKTDNGIRRVTIADCIQPFIAEWLNYSKTETLLCTLDHKPFLYRNYYDSYWIQLLEPLNMTYRPHMARHTFVSLMAQAKIEQTTIKKSLGIKVLCH